MAKLKPACVYLSPPHSGEYEQQFVAEAFKSNWIASLGLYVDGVELWGEICELAQKCLDNTLGSP